MATLEQLGVTVARSFNTETSSTQVGGIELSSSEKKTTRLTLGLPKEAKIKAEFCTESFAKKLIKIFKKEIQTGDQVFDDAIYISTETPEATAQFLTNADLRMTILALVESGPIQISGKTVTAVVADHSHDEDPGVVRLLSALLD
jgi:hypothetical protein